MSKRNRPSFFIRRLPSGQVLDCNRTFSQSLRSARTDARLHGGTVLVVESRQSLNRVNGRMHHRGVAVCHRQAGSSSVRCVTMSHRSTLG